MNEDLEEYKKNREEYINKNYSKEDIEDAKLFSEQMRNTLNLIEIKNDSFIKSYEKKLSDYLGVDIKLVKKKNSLWFNGIKPKTI